MVFLKNGRSLRLGGVTPVLQNGGKMFLLTLHRRNGHGLELRMVLCRHGTMQ